MRGLPQPDISLAFLRPEQVVEQLQRLEGAELEEISMGEDEDEDGIDIEGLRNRSGRRETLTDEPDDFGLDSDDSELSEYQDRRRIRQEELHHEEQRRRLGLLRRSLRLERHAFDKSVPQVATMDLSTDDSDDEVLTRAVVVSADLGEVMRRYDERLARLDEEERQHTRAAKRLFQHHENSARQARQRQRGRDQARRAVEAQRVRHAQEEARARVRAQEADLQRAIIKVREEAAQAEAKLVRRQQQWLASARRPTQIAGQRRRALGELDVANYPVDESMSRGSPFGFTHGV